MGTYGDIYNLKEDFEDILDKNQIREEFEIDEDSGEEEIEEFIVK